MLTDAEQRVVEWVDEERAAALDRHGPFSSSHEAYGVLAEEVSELLAAIHANKWGAIQSESVQVAAVALRLACEIEDNAECRARSGCC